MGSHARLHHRGGRPLNGLLGLTEAERATLCEIDHRLGRTALEEVAAAAISETAYTYKGDIQLDRWSDSGAKPELPMFD